MNESSRAWLQVAVGDLALVTDFVANGSFASLRENVQYLSTPDYAILVRLKDHNQGWKGPFVYLNKAAYQYLSKSSLRIGDLVIANVGDPGRLFLVPDLGRPMSLGPNGILVRAFDPITCNTFLSYFFSSLKGRSKIERIVTGSAQQKFNKTEFRKILVPIPPLREQRRIMAKLEELLARVDAAQARLETIPRILKRFLQSVLDAACSGRLTADWRLKNPSTEPAETLLSRIRKQKNLEVNDNGSSNRSEQIPATWLRVRIEELTSIQNGRAFPSKQYCSIGIRLLRPGNLHVSGDVKWTEKNTACLPASWAKEYPDFVLGRSELLMNLTAQSLKDEFLGRVCVKRDAVPALLNQRIARFINHGTDDLRPFLFIYLKSPQFRSYVNTLDTGSLIRHMHSKQVLSHRALLPPLAEQQEIVRRVEALFKTADVLEARYLKAKAHIDKLTQSILAKAFRGELVPQDPNDEPASVLLERIFMEKFGKDVTKKGRRK